MKKIVPKKISGIYLHIIFWLVVWIFKGLFQYSLNLESYPLLPLKTQLFLNFGVELLQTFVKIGLCYFTAHLYFINKDNLNLATMIQIMMVFILGILLRLSVFSVFINLNSDALPFFESKIFFEISRWMYSIIDNGFFLGIFLFFKNYAHQLRSIKREQLLINEKLIYEMAFLRTQVNPHFLFNSLNNLFSIAQHEKNNELADGISKLSGMMRYMIYESNSDFVQLEKEIDYINDFIGLNKLRYDEDEVCVKFKYPKLTTPITIAPMILIPFVENAFKHGVVISKQSTINLSLEVTTEYILFSCINDVSQINDKFDEGEFSFGLKNVKRRLNLIYPDLHELTITNNEICFSTILKIFIS